MILTHSNGNKTFYQSVWPAPGNDPENDLDNGLGNGNAETLLLLHGLGADHMMWKPQMQSYAEASFHLLVPDLFGHGCSAKLTQIGLTDWHRQINDLLGYNNVEKCTLMGVSMGGVIALSFAVAYPHKVDRLIVSDTFCELRTWRERFLGYSAVAGISALKLFGRKSFVKGMRATYKAPYAKVAQVYFEQVSQTTDLSQMRLARKAINRVDVWKDLAQLTFPALVMVGEDFGGFFINTNYKIAAALPNADFVILKKAMDPSNLVNPAKFDKQVLQFLLQR
ncbi:MAG: alpha/beta hydrolase [Cyanobacteria bacterium P01_F01_bin.53]